MFLGTRTTLINKGEIAQWNPSRLESVTEELINQHFEESAGEEQRKMLRKLQINVNSKI